MLLTSAQVKQFKSIEDSGQVSVDRHVTVLVGQNESGKTAFLQALHKSRSVDKTEFTLMEDFPRKRLNAYLKEHEKNPATVTELVYSLEQPELDRINESLGVDLLDSLTFTRLQRYDGSSSVMLQVPEQPYVQHMVSQADLPEDLAIRASQAAGIRQLISILEAANLNDEGKALLKTLNDTFGKVPESWQSMLNYVLWTKAVGPRVPRFLYFDDYYLLPGKINLPQLQRNIERQATIADEDKTVLSLLRLAGVELDSLMVDTGYESVKAKLEAISNSITDRVFEYWKQNQDLEVEFDIREDPHDQPPFNVGSNLYIRIRDRRHRVTVPFSQRSKGFVWFFSFIVWFDSIKQHLGTNADLILLLDEPGLSLHALAQGDFLRYIEDLSKNHQILYSTHSPFMVPADGLYQVRTVEVKPVGGSLVSNDFTKSEAKTLYPLQAALGYKLARNLFTNKRNLLVEGPAELIYLKYFSGLLDKHRRTTLKDDITIVPMGGMSRLGEFMALLGADEVELGVLEGAGIAPGNNGQTDQEQTSQEQEDTIRQTHVISYSTFRSQKSTNGTGSRKGGEEAATAAGVEDLLPPSVYLRLFNGAYKEELGGIQLSEADLPASRSIKNRIEAYLRANSIELRQGGGYDPYVVASYLASNPLPASKVDAATLDRFEQLFQAVNALYSS